MLSAIGPVNEVNLQLSRVPARHHDVACFEVPVAALLMHITQGLHPFMRKLSREEMTDQDIGTTPSSTISHHVRLRPDAGLQCIAIGQPHIQVFPAAAWSDMGAFKYCTSVQL